jgi:uncharacterized membrane protein (UPF0127 family)
MWRELRAIVVAMRATRTTVMRASDKLLVCDDCVVAESPVTRLRGLLGRAALASGEGLLLRPCASVHTWFMGFAIDALFLDRDLRVVRVAADLRPWHMAAARRAKAVLELPAGAAARSRIEPGDQLVLG